MTPWNFPDLASGLGGDALAPVLACDPPVKVLLVGCGASMTLLPPELRSRLKALGLVADVMSTGAACRTYNVLLAEKRPIAAALVAV